MCSSRILVFISICLIFSGLSNAQTDSTGWFFEAHGGQIVGDTITVPPDSNMNRVLV